MLMTQVRPEGALHKGSAVYCMPASPCKSRCVETSSGLEGSMRSSESTLSGLSQALRKPGGNTRSLGDRDLSDTAGLCKVSLRVRQMHLRSAFPADLALSVALWLARLPE